jgi:hypothetical protein
MICKAAVSLIRKWPFRESLSFFAGLLENQTGNTVNFHPLYALSFFASFAGLVNPLHKWQFLGIHL